MNRNTTRRVQKLTGQEIKEIEYKSMLKGIKGTMKIYEDVIRKELGMEVEDE